MQLVCLTASAEPSPWRGKLPTCEHRGVTEVQSWKRSRCRDAAAAAFHVPPTPTRRRPPKLAAKRVRHCASSQTQRPPTRLGKGGGTASVADGSHLLARPAHSVDALGRLREGVRSDPPRCWQKPGVARRCGPSEGLLAPSPPPTPAGCRGGAQRLPSLPGRRSGKRGRQHTSVRALAPDSLLSTQTRAWGLNARIGGLQNRPGGAKSRAQAVEPMCPCQLLLGKPNRLCGSFTPNRRRPPLPLLCWLMDTML